MKKQPLSKLTVAQLADRFAELGLEQYEAHEEDDIPRVNRLYRKMDAIDEELRARGREARLALVPLFDHPNVQVRMQAARFAFALAPEAARKCLQAIGDSGMPPQYLYARLALQFIDDGTAKLT